MVIVTGSSGFIGRNLMERGAYTGLDRPHDVRGAIPSCDAIVHLAAMSGVMECEAAPGTAWSINVDGTRNVCSQGVPVIFASTAGAMKSNGVYARTKRAGEAFVLSVGGTVLRFANVYGPHMEGKNSLIANILRGSVTLRGDGSQTRDFIHVEDVCRAIEIALQDRPRGVFTVATGKMYSVNEVLEIAEGLTGFHVEPGSMGESEVEDGSFPLNPLPGWTPIIGLEKGLRGLLCPS